MTDKFALIYQENTDRVSLKDLVPFFSRKGIGLVNPNNQLVTEVSEWGNQVPSGRATIQAKLDSHQDVNFQWWFGGEFDLFCGVSFLSADTLVQYYSLDGKPQEVQRRLAEILLSLFHRYIVESTAWALVVDARGYTEGFDWTGLVQGRAVGVPDSWPDILGLKTGFAEKFEPFLFGYEIEDKKAFRFYFRKDFWLRG